MERIIILDCGSQHTQLIARLIREFNVYCEIHPCNNIPEIDSKVKGVIISDGPFSVKDSQAPSIDLAQFRGRMPVLGIGYGAQYLAVASGAEVKFSEIPEPFKVRLGNFCDDNPLFKNISAPTDVWVSKGDIINTVSGDLHVTASADDMPVIAFRVGNEDTWGVQFQPEVPQTEDGVQVLKNFVLGVCGCKQDWTPAKYVETTIRDLRQQIGGDKVVLGLSGGVDSSVVAELLHRAIGDQLTCIFVDTGLMRKNEAEEVLASYKSMGLNVIGVRAGEKFLSDLKGVIDPEQKRKIIGRDFIEVFDAEAHKLADVKWLGQGTIYPDIIESISVSGVTIKSHHNVGGLPEKMNLRIVEPLRLLFKDEVRKIGRELNVPADILNRHPFPGPGLGIRVLGEVTAERIRILQDADRIFIDLLKEWGLYNEVWQAGVMLLPVQSVGVACEARTYEWAVVLRAVSSIDAMTAEWVRLPYEFLARASNDIINNVEGVNRVVYDISSKPPATIEWE